MLIGLPARIKDTEHLALWWSFPLIFFLFFLKVCEENLPVPVGVLSHLCLEVISAVLTPGHVLRAAGIQGTPSSLRTCVL